MKLFIKVLLALLFLYKVTSAQVNVVVNLPPVMPSELNQWRDNPSLVTIIFNNPGAPINNLRIGYKINHYLALIFCFGGLSCSLVNDIVIYPKDQSDISNNFTLKAFYGDLMVIGGAFLYAT